MLTGNMVLGVGLGLMVLSCALFLYGGGGRNPEKRPRHPKWAAAGGFLSGLAFLVLGVAAPCLALTSAHREITGRIADLAQFSGKYAKSQFHIQGDRESSPLLITQYNGASLKEGERAHVTYKVFDKEVVDLEIISGPTKGWKLHESEPFLLMLFCTLLGLGFMVESYRVWTRGVYTY